MRLHGITNPDDQIIIIDGIGTMSIKMAKIRVRQMLKQLQGLAEIGDQEAYADMSALLNSHALSAYVHSLKTPKFVKNQ